MTDLHERQLRTFTRSRSGQHPTGYLENCLYPYCVYTYQKSDNTNVMQICVLILNSFKKHRLHMKRMTVIKSKSNRIIICSRALSKIFGFQFFAANTFVKQSLVALQPFIIVYMYSYLRRWVPVPPEGFLL